MDIERLRKILRYSKENRAGTETKIKQFFLFVGMDYPSDVLNILQVVRLSFERRGYLVLEMPLADAEIGAACYKGDGLGYVMVNSSLPMAHENFALAHEVYHVCFQKRQFAAKVEFSREQYCDNEEELAANLFSGMLLMPENGFRRMFRVFWEASHGKSLDTLVKLMAYYQVPYMSVLIRSYELELLEKSNMDMELLEMTGEAIREKFRELWLDERLLQPTRRDDFPFLETLVKGAGEEYVAEEYLSKRALEKALKNIFRLHEEIRGR